jgi:hypothetical protein
VYGFVHTYVHMSEAGSACQRRVEQESSQAPVSTATGCQHKTPTFDLFSIVQAGLHSVAALLLCKIWQCSRQHSEQFWNMC